MPEWLTGLIWTLLSMGCGAAIALVLELTDQLVRRIADRLQNPSSEHPHVHGQGGTPVGHNGSSQAVVSSETGFGQIEVNEQQPTDEVNDVG